MNLAGLTVHKQYKEWIEF